MHNYSTWSENVRVILGFPVIRVYYSKPFTNKVMTSGTLVCNGLLFENSNAPFQHVRRCSHIKHSLLSLYSIVPSDTEGSDKIGTFVARIFD